MTQAHRLPAVPLEDINIVVPMASPSGEYEANGFLYDGPLVEGKVNITLS
jgi:hypothetical protein